MTWKEIALQINSTLPTISDGSSNSQIKIKPLIISPIDLLP